ncbi:MAG: cupredoxin domain-containing protein [Actinomycetota bacterium]
MRRLVSVFALMSAVALIGSACTSAKDSGFPSGTATPSVATPVPSSGTSVAASEATIVAKNMQFDLKELAFAADVPIALTLDNQDAGIPHNFSIYEGTTVIYKGEFFTGVGKRTYQIPPLKAGTYRFQCDAHPTMEGTVVVE